MLSCKDLSEKASDYLEGELPFWTRLEIRAHVFLCEHCRNYLQQLRFMTRALALAGRDEALERVEEEEVLRRILAAHPQGRPDAESAVFVEPEVVIYTTDWCPYCRRAKALLDRKGVEYLEIDVEAEPAKRREMVARAGGRTSVPQIFIHGHAIGGSDKLHALEASSELDRLLGRE